MKGKHWMLLGLYLVAMLTLAACARGEFPAWLIQPEQVSSEAGSNDSDMPAIYTDNDGNVVVAWSSDPAGNPGHSDSEIYWRRYNAMGEPQTPPVRLTTNSFGDYYPSIGMSGGVTYLVWMGDEITSSNIYWAAVDQDGNLIAGPENISDPTYNDYDPHLIQCGNYSQVYWSGDSASMDFEIYYAKVRYNGIQDVPYKSVTNLSWSEHSPHGEVDRFCNRLFIAYELDFTLTNSDVFLVGVNTLNGSNAFGPFEVTSNPADENDIDTAVTSPPFADTLISVVWNRDDGAGGEIIYASRYANGTICAPAFSLTADSQIDARPVVENITVGSNKDVLVAWERVQPGTGTDRDIYASFFADDCTPSPPASPTLISESAVSANVDDVYPQALIRLAPNDIPIYDVVWRTLSDGAVWSRFGSFMGPSGASDLISNNSSAGYPADAERPAAVTTLGNQVYVTWVGNNLGTVETWYQQTVWHASMPIVLK